MNHMGYYILQTSGLWHSNCLSYRWSNLMFPLQRPSSIQLMYSRITLVVPNYEAAPRLFYSKYFWQRYITCDSAAHQELPMGKIFPEILNLCESRKFCDDPASRWAILPPSDLLTLIDFSFWLPQIKSGRIH